MKQPTPRDKTAGSRIAFLQIRVSKQFEEQFLQSILAFTDSARSDRPQSRIFREALQKNIKDPNVPNVLRASPARLLKTLKRQWATKPTFRLIALWVWKTDHLDLYEAVSQWLTTNQARSIGSFYNSPDGGDGEQIDKTLSSWAAQVVQEKPDFGIEPIKMAMAHVLYGSQYTEVIHQTGADSARDSPAENVADVLQRASEDTEATWQSIISGIRAMPVDCFSGGQVEQFIDQVRGIADSKRRESAILADEDALRSEVDTVVSELAQWESYLKLHTHHGWTVARVPVHDRKSVRGSLVDLTHALHDLADLRGRQPSNREERRALDQATSAAEDRVLQVYERLSEVFFVPRGDAVENPDPGVGGTISEPRAHDDSASAGNASRGPSDDSEKAVIACAPSEPESGSGLQQDARMAPPSDSEGPVPEVAADLISNVLDSAADRPARDLTQQPETNEPVIIPAQLASDAADPTLAGTGIASESIVSACVDRGELGRAYWIARVEEELGRAPCIPSTLIAGHFGLLRLMRSWAELDIELLSEVRDVAAPTRVTLDIEQSVYALSLGLVLGLLEPGLGWETWLNADLSNRAIHLGELTIEADRFMQAGCSLDPRVMQAIHGQQKTEERIRELAARAKGWLEQAPLKGTRFAGADDVWKGIVGSRGSLHSWYDLVAEDQRDSASGVQTHLETWGSRAWLTDLIQKMYRDLRGRGKPISGEPAIS